MKILPLSLILTLFCSTSTAWGAGEVPLPWSDHINLDQNHNVRRRARPNRHADDFLREHEKLVIPNYFVDVPADDSELAVEVDTEALSPDILRYLSPDPSKVRFHFVKIEGNSASNVFADETIVQEGESTKLMSHGTRFSFKSHGQDVIHIKMRHSQFAKDYNRAGEVPLSVIHSAMIRRSLATAAHPDFVYLAEPFAASIRKRGQEYAFSLRQAQPTDTASGHSFLPLHGVLSESQILRFSSASGKPKSAWVQEEYLPKLAKTLAELNHRYGIIPQAHTQNLLVEINPSNGKIARFVYRDSADCLFDLFNHHDKFGIKKGHYLFSKLNHHYTRDGKESMGAHFSTFSAQSFYAFESEEDRSTRFKNGALFLKTYFLETKKIIGADIPLSEKAQWILEFMEAGGNSEGLRNLKALTAEFVQELSDNATRIQSERNYPRLATENPRKDLARHFLEYLDYGNVAIAYPRIAEAIASSPDAYVYSWVNDKIYVRDPTDYFRLVAFAYHVVAPASSVNDCGFSALSSSN